MQLCNTVCNASHTVLLKLYVVAIHVQYDAVNPYEENQTCIYTMYAQVVDFQIHCMVLGHARQYKLLQYYYFDYIA